MADSCKAIVIDLDGQGDEEVDFEKTCSECREVKLVHPKSENVNQLMSAFPATEELHILDPKHWEWRCHDLKHLRSLK